MRRITGLLWAALFLTAVPAAVPAAEQLQELFSRVDANHEEAAFEENRRLLQDAEEMAATDEERAAYLWRLSRNVLFLTDERKRDGASSDELLERYNRGMDLADRAVSLAPGSHHGYYWRASNLGRWGQTKGILNSLVKAGPMRDDLIRAVNLEPDHADSYYVLGILYASVPRLLSFGNVEYAVSYSRKALDAYVGLKTKASYYKKLAEHLHQRDWNVRKRRRHFDSLEQEYRRADSPAERNKYFEGVFDEAAPRIYARSGVERLTDREEAVRIITWLIDELESAGSLTSTDRVHLQEARQLRDQWS